MKPRHMVLLVAGLPLCGCVSTVEKAGDVAVAAVEIPFRAAHAAVDAASGKDHEHHAEAAGGD